jgi:hypothetical protein
MRTPIDLIQELEIEGGQPPRWAALFVYLPEHIELLFSHELGKLDKLNRLIENGGNAFGLIGEKKSEGEISVRQLPMPRMRTENFIQELKKLEGEICPNRQWIPLMSTAGLIQELERQAQYLNWAALMFGFVSTTPLLLSRREGNLDQLNELVKHGGEPIGIISGCGLGGQVSIRPLVKSSAEWTASSVREHILSMAESIKQLFWDDIAPYTGKPYLVKRE